MELFDNNGKRIYLYEYIESSDSVIYYYSYKKISNEDFQKEIDYTKEKWKEFEKEQYRIWNLELPKEEEDILLNELWDNKYTMEEIDGSTRLEKKFPLMRIRDILEYKGY